MKKVISVVLAIAILIGGVLFLKNYVSDALSAAYDEGYAEGHKAGNTTGYRTGYSAGKNAGYNLGYDDGYDDGTASVAASTGSNRSSIESIIESHGGNVSSQNDMYYGTSYIGNVNSGVFHRLDCSYLPQPQNCVAIYSRASAISQGYRPCGHCNP